MARAFRILAALLVLIGLGWSQAHAAVAFDACGTSETNNNSATSLNFTNLTVGSGSNRALLAFLVFSNQSITGLAVTWNGVSLSQVAAVNTNGAAGRVEIWGLVNPASGANTLAVSWTGTSQVIVDGCAWTGVDQTGGVTSFPNATTVAPGAQTTLSLAVTSAVGNVVAAAWVNASNLINSVDNTQIYINNAGLNVDGAANRGVGAATVTLSETNSAGAIAAGAATDIKAAGGGATCPHTLSTLGAGC